MGNFERLNFSHPLFDDLDHQRMTEVCAAVRGYSDARHYGFFRTLFAQAEIERVLLLGVYFGRDIIFMLDAARRACRQISITGVDKFSDDACADWPSDRLGCSWEQAGFGTAPSLAAAQHTIATFGGGAEVRLIRQHDEAFLEGCTDRFDLIYLDTAHDAATVRRQLRQAAPLLAPGGVLAGDDYSDQGTWGVRSALSEVAPGHAVFAGWIWVAAREHLAAAARVIA